MLVDSVHINGKTINIHSHTNGFRARYTTGYDIDGKQIQKTIRRRSIEAVKEQIFSEFDAFYFMRQAPEVQVTVATGMKQWLDLRYKPNTDRNGTYLCYRNLLKNNIIPYIGNITIKNLTVEEAQQHADKQYIKYEPSTVNSAIALTRRFFEEFVHRHTLPYNPYEDVMLKKVAYHTVVPYTLDELKSFLIASKGSKYEDFIGLVAFTGLRIGEAIALRWNHINWNDKTILISATAARGLPERHTGLLIQNSTKGNRDRIIIIPDVALPYLYDAAEKQIMQKQSAGTKWNENNLVFTKDNGSMMNYSEIYKNYHHIQEAANVPKVCFHNLRHTFASLVYSYSRDIHAIQKQLGHRYISTTIDYISMIDKDQKQSVNGINDLFASLPEIQNSNRPIHI